MNIRIRKVLLYLVLAFNIWFFILGPSVRYYFFKQDNTYPWFFILGSSVKNYFHWKNSPPPPDLRTCTRIDISYLQPLAVCLGYHNNNAGLFSPQQWDCINVRKISVTDIKLIRRLANDLSSKMYYWEKMVKHDADNNGVPGSVPPIFELVCYKNKQNIASFSVYCVPFDDSSSYVFFNEGIFEYRHMLASLNDIIRPKINVFLKSQGVAPVTWEE